jgi:predicted nuclease of predicted toxin-antitoxin system
MQLYADEDFEYPVVEEMRHCGHDVITAQDDGRASAKDQDILARAHSLGRSVLTHNRLHYEHLHRRGDPHSGMVSASHDTDFVALAMRIDRVLQGIAPGRWCIRVNKPP